MMTRAEKLFSIRAQVRKAVSEIEHGDTPASCLALGGALSGVVKFLEEEILEQWTVEPLKEPDPIVRQALDTLRESTKIKRR